MHVSLFGFELLIDLTHVGASEPEVRRQIDAYVAGDREEFDLTIAHPEGLTGDVMRSMTQIPYGETRTYGDLAADLDTAPMAVGQACGRNPVPLVVPCHRVVAADGLGGYSGAGGVGLKRRLLQHEGALSEQNQTQTTLDEL